MKGKELGRGGKKSQAGQMRQGALSLAENTRMHSGREQYAITWARPMFFYILI